VRWTSSILKSSSEWPIDFREPRDHNNIVNVYQAGVYCFGAGERKRILVTEKGWVWVNDKAGNLFVCKVEDLKDPKDVSEEELKNCTDDATMGANIGD
jgi:hypothetical protein